MSSKLQLDALLQDEKGAKCVRLIMKHGKKELAEKILYDSLKLINAKSDVSPTEVFHSAIANVTPSVELKSVRIAGTTYQVPIEINENRQLSLALK